MSTVDPDMGARVAEAIDRLGIDVRTDTWSSGLEQQDGRVRAVVTADGALPADIVVLGLGVRPNTALAADSGIPLGVTGGMPDRPADAGGRAVATRRVGGRRLRADHPPGQRPAGARTAGHARQQAGPGGRHQHRRRVRDLPGRHRHRGDQGLRARGGAHRADREGGHGGGVRVRHRDGRVDQPGRLLPGRATR